MDKFRLLEEAPVSFEEIVNSMDENDRRRAMQDMEGIAQKATLLASYLSERYGHGCGDQGHKSASKKAIRDAKKLWCKIFGYNGYFLRSF